MIWKIWQREYGIEERVVLPGRISYISEKLSEAKIFVLPSDYEGMPNALMEAMAVGIPVISTDCPCGGPKILIEDESQGILVPCNNAEALAQALCRLLKDDDLREKMGAAGEKRALMFKPDVIFSHWENYIDDVLWII